MGPFCQRHNYKNLVEEGTQTNVCWYLIYAGIGPITKGAVQRDDTYHRRHCASLAIVTARHCIAGLHLHRRDAILYYPNLTVSFPPLSLSSLSLG